MDYHPLGPAAIVFENLFIGFMVIVNLVLLVIFSVSMEASEFLALPLVIEWFTLVVVSLYLLVRESRTRGTPPSLAKAIIMFGTQFLLGLGTNYSVRSFLKAILTYCYSDFPRPDHPRLARLHSLRRLWKSPPPMRRRSRRGRHVVGNDHRSVCRNPTLMWWSFVSSVPRSSRVSETEDQSQPTRDRAR
ncbi:hypothetical protein B0H17DRAFT_471590 [Mycena rosella]|uniref:Uncharacterized protein n=1 Tax=Mycena rosella TaxID=1033263 RepID=A0AAD7DKW4_MYCRO|nr:hypothetical protein B0H17DRAFT_471590 [Mycena rosella]